jgi:hypothetical protein
MAHSKYSLGTRSALIEFMMGGIGATFMLISSALHACNYYSLYLVIAFTVVASVIVWRSYAIHNLSNNSLSR